MERARPPAPSGLFTDHQDMMRRVFTSMAGRRLLPKEGWSLNRAIHDTAAPTVMYRLYRARVGAGSAPLALPHRLLEDTRRRLVVQLLIDGDFTNIQERPLSLPPFLVRLELYGFRGELGPPPSGGLRELRLCATSSIATSVHHLLTDIQNGEAVTNFFRETAEVLRALLPAVRALEVHGEYEPYRCVHVRTFMPALLEVPHPNLKGLSLDGWKVHWEDLLPLLSSTVAELQLEACQCDSDAGSDRLTVPPLPEGFSSLTLRGCPGSRFQPLGDLPPGLRVLKLRCYTHPLPPLPDTLETLVLDHCTHHVDDVFDSARLLSLSWRPPQPTPSLPSRWPARLKRLVYWGKPDTAEPQRIQNLPSTLTRLELNRCELHADLPRTLRELHLGNEFTQELNFKEFTGRIHTNSTRSSYH
ncbi:hypothetical protein JKP88DRAFT_322275 [Tribonema minus]|uniref:Uncharacterized protein n=1 Tax=Tribonema minus TaxID=303371 RepID=A0A836CD10_9STRA|nr:hypothetical protein JKP88DRAFT_322275 [Tribonema minus]